MAPVALGLAGVAFDETDPLRYNSGAWRAGGNPARLAGRCEDCTHARDTDWEGAVWL
jgi:hypothetical protein